MDQILAIEKEIMENSPTRHSQIDHQMIHNLKQKRLKQRSQQAARKLKSEQENLIISPSKKQHSSPDGKSP